MSIERVIDLASLVAIMEQAPSDPSYPINEMLVLAVRIKDGISSEYSAEEVFQHLSAKYPKADA